MEKENIFVPDTGRIIQLLSEKIARLEQENAALIAQSERLISYAQSIETELIKIKREPVEVAPEEKINA